MRFFTPLALAAAARLASAHSTVYAVWINDVDQGLGNSASGYIRSPPNNNPITDVTSTDMTCNVDNSAVAKTLEVSGGDKITFEWHHNSRDSSDDIIATSHLGPVMVYIAPTSSDGSGDVWVKLYEDGYTDGTWAVDTLIANGGKHSITLPDLTAGEYLLRPEIIALHEGYREGGAQFYMECVQIKVTSSGSVDLPTGVAIPGTYSATDPGILFDLYNGFTSYTIPGPAVWDGTSSGSSGSSTGSSSSAAASSAAPVSATSAASVVEASSYESTPSAATSPVAVTSVVSSPSPSFVLASSVSTPVVSSAASPVASSPSVVSPSSISTPIAYGTYPPVSYGATTFATVIKTTEVVVTATGPAPTATSPAGGSYGSGSGSTGGKGRVPKYQQWQEILRALMKKIRQWLANMN